MNEFNPIQSYHFAKRLLIYNKQVLILTISIAVGIMLFISLVDMLINNYFNMNAPVYIVIVLFFVGGLVLSSRILSELGMPQKAYSMISLPASTLEKLFAAWFISSILYVVSVFIIIFSVTTMFSLLSSALYDTTFYVMKPNDFHLFEALYNYMIIQTIFLFGGIVFSNLPFIKTLLAIIIFLVAFGIASVILTWIIFGDEFRLAFEMNDKPMVHDNFTHFFTNTFPVIMKTLYWGVLGPFFLVLSYFKFREKEV